jgi:hypothetical protein
MYVSATYRRHFRCARDADVDRFGIDVQERVRRHR